MSSYLSILFLFKYKTAYELLISDWSSDGCSSDLTPVLVQSVQVRCPNPPHPRNGLLRVVNLCWVDHLAMIALGKPLGCCVHRCDELNPSPCLPLHLTHRHAPFSQCGWFHLLACHDVMSKSLRSEEHTSELQSLMRISYAVFCLKKKKRIHT